MDDSDFHKNSIIDALDTQMRCGILSNADGQILIIHDQALRSSVQWIEYDQAESSFILVYEDGKIQPLGLKLDRQMSDNLVHGQKVILNHIQDGVIAASQDVVFIVKDT